MKLKGIVIGLALTLAFTMTGQAISIQELQSSPQFKVIHESRLMCRVLMRGLPGIWIRVRWRSWNIRRLFIR